jgi:hypothetical protein
MLISSMSEIGLRCCEPTEEPLLALLLLLMELTPLPVLTTGRPESL